MHASSHTDFFELENSGVRTVTIGFFDSGIGGLSILPHVMKEIPGAICYYIADDYFAPYGQKESEFVIQRSIFLTKTLLFFNVDLIVVACNTATAVAINQLRIHFPSIPFVGVEPYINILSKENFLKDDKIGVLSTTLTSKSERFKKLKEEKDHDNRIVSYASENLAMLVEECFKERKIGLNMRIRIEEEVAFLKKEKLNYLILGCTHYSLIKKSLENILNLTAISPCENVAKRVAGLIKAVSFSADVGPSKTFYFVQSSACLKLQCQIASPDFSFEKWDIDQIPFL